MMIAISPSYKQIPNLAFILFEKAHGNQTFSSWSEVDMREKQQCQHQGKHDTQTTQKSHRIVVIHLKTACEAAQNTKIQNTSVAE